MPRRTIAEAREELDRMTLAPATRREYEQFLTRHVKKEEAQLSVQQSERYQSLNEAVSEVKKGYVAIEQQMEDLERESRSKNMWVCPGCG